MRYLQFLLCVGVFAPIVTFAQNPEIVSGTIAQNTSWTKDKTYCYRVWSMSKMVQR